MKRPWRLSIWFAAAIAVPTTLAFTISSNRWLNGTTLFYTGIPRTAASGATFASAFESAMGEWNAKTDFEFRAQREFIDPCSGNSRGTTGDSTSGNGDSRNSIDFRSTVCGDEFGNNVLAITLTFSNPGRLGFNLLREADIIFNDKLNWDVYDGPRKTGITDFRRVALHELGHAIGLNHEPTLQAIMAPRISDLFELQLDDRAGAEAIYGIPVNCSVTDLKINSLLRNSLDQNDCRVQQLFGGGTDDSFVDVYRLNITTTTRIIADMRSSVMDPVLVLTDSKMNELDIADDFQGNCNARMDKTLLPGEYRLLANTYATPRKCNGNVGAYSLSISDGVQPLLGDTATFNNGITAAALFSGGATANGGLNYRSVFDPTESIDVNSRIAIDPAHVGKNGKVYVVVQMGNGSQFSKSSTGEFVPLSDVSQLVPYKSGPLVALEAISVVKGLRAQGSWFAGKSFIVHTGYAIDSAPQDIHYGTSPIQFAINP